MYVAFNIYTVVYPCWLFFVLVDSSGVLFLQPETSVSISCAESAGKNFKLLLTWKGV